MGDWPYQKSQERGGWKNRWCVGGILRRGGFCRKGEDAVSLGIFSSWAVANVTTETSNYILVIVFLFPLNVGVSPCFHCTVLVPVSIMLLSVPVTGYILLLAWCRCYVLFQSEHVALIYSWNMSLVRSWWESAHIRFNLWSVHCMFYDLVLTSPWGKLHQVPTAMLIAIMISIRTHSVLQTHSFYSFHGFILIFLSLPDSGVSS